MIKAFDISRQTLEIKSEFKLELEKILDNNDFIGGKEIKSFENNFAKFTGALHCASVANGTDALELILEALDIQEGEVIVPAMTFAATAEAVVRAGATPKFVDIDDSYTLDVEKLQKSLGNKTRAIIAVNLHGNPSNLVEIENIANKNDLFLIQDSAQAHGTVPALKKLGDYGTASAFSFYPGKTLGAFGDGGAVITSDEKLLEKIQRIKNHGRLQKFDHEMLGRNSRLDTIQALVLNIKLRLLGEWIRRRIEVAEMYEAEFSQINWIKTPLANKYGKSSYHQYVITSEHKTKIEKSLRTNNIEFGYHYPYVVSELAPFERYANENFDVARLVATQGISLPIGEHLTNKEVETVINVVLNSY